MNDTKFKKVKIDWDAVQKELESRTGQAYSKGYLMGVKNGNHRNNTVFEHLKEMGIV